MDHQEARELLDLRDRATRHLHEVQEYVIELEARCEAAQPEKILDRRPPDRRKRHLRVIKAIFIGAGAGAGIRKLMAALALPAVGAAAAVAVMTLPNVGWNGPGGTPRATTAPAGTQGTAYGPRRRRQGAPLSRRSQPGDPGRAHHPARPSPSTSATRPVLQPSPTPSTGPLPSLPPVSVPVSVPPVSVPPVSLPPVSVPPTTCVLGICVSH